MHVPIVSAGGFFAYIVFAAIRNMKAKKKKVRDSQGNKAGAPRAMRPTPLMGDTSDTDGRDGRPFGGPLLPIVL